MKHMITTAIALLLCASSAFANEYYSYNSFDDALVTDRPDAAEASVTVGQNRFQIETSFAFSNDKDAGVTTRDYSFPTLLRYGIIDPLELRVEGNFFTAQTATGATSQKGFNDFEVGLKAHLIEGGEGLLPSLGLLAHMSVPVGKDNFSSNGVEPVFKALADWDLPAGFSLGTNVGMDVPVRDNAGDKFARFLYAAAIGHGIPGTNDRLSAFVESAGAVSLKSGKVNEHQINSGLAFLITPNVQIDTAVEFGLNDNTSDFATGFGLSWRL